MSTVVTNTPTESAATGAEFSQYVEREAFGMLSRIIAEHRTAGLHSLSIFTSIDGKRSVIAIDAGGVLHMAESIQAAVSKATLCTLDAKQKEAA